MATPVKSRRSQRERRDQTRRALLDATVECLTELGYAHTTTLEVQRRADVSRGALLHHFPSKARLLVGCIRHLAHLRGVELRERVAELPHHSGDRIGVAIDLLWESFTGPLFYVSMELRTAARTDAELRAVLLEEELALRGRILAQCREMFGDDIASRPGFDDALDVTLQLMMGAAMSAVLHSDDARLIALIAFWKSQFADLVTVAESHGRDNRGSR